jgi:hypothetical protein
VHSGAISFGDAFSDGLPCNGTAKSVTGVGLDGGVGVFSASLALDTLDGEEGLADAPFRCAV